MTSYTNPDISDG